MKTLIIYATEHGSTKKCAEILLEKLTGQVDLYNVKDKKSPELSQYDNVIIGGSIYMGRIQKELSEFTAKNLNVLKNKKVGLYICCMNKNEAENQLNSAFPEELLKCSIVQKSFGGEFNFKKMNFFERFVIKIVSKSLSKEKTKEASLPLNMKKDVLMLSEENINMFAQLMN